MEKEEAQDIVREFKEGTEQWYESLFEDYKHKPCVMCGIIPDNMTKLAEAIRVLNI